MGGFCLLMELHRKGSAPAACAAGLFNYTQMKMKNLSPPTENINSLREACGNVRTTAVTAFAEDYLATDWLCLLDLA